MSDTEKYNRLPDWTKIGADAPKPEPAPAMKYQPIPDYKPNDLGNYRGKRGVKPVATNVVANAMDADAAPVSRMPRRRDHNMLAIAVLAVMGMYPQ